MQQIPQSDRRRRARQPRLLALVVAVAIPLAAGAAYQSRVDGAAFSLNNSASGNKVVAFDRRDDGTLQRRAVFSTGGRGTGVGLGSQGALAATDSGRWLFAVNAGSNTVSVFLVIGSHLWRTDVESTRGSKPISVTTNGDEVYVLNAGSGTLQGFRLSVTGSLVPIPRSQRPLSGAATDPAQVQFNRAGDLVAVTEKAVNKVVTYRLDGDGLLSKPSAQKSPGKTPFGFAFGRRDVMLVSEAGGGAAGASSLSSWQADGQGKAKVISGHIANRQSASCWVAGTRDGRYAFVSNTGSNNVSTYGIGENGQATLLRAAAGATGAAPADNALDRNNRFLYTLDSMSSSISVFAVHSDGSLSAVERESSKELGMTPAGLVVM